MGYAPCKDCTERHVGCHSECEKYARFCAENEKRKELQRRENLTAILAGKSPMVTPCRNKWRSL